MDRDHEQSREFTRRALLIGAMQGGLLALLGGRLAWLQLVQGQRYKTLAEENRINLKMMAPSRGIIYDRAGVKMAVNDQNFRVLVVPEQTDDLRQALVSLQKLITLDDRDVQRVLKAAEKSPRFAALEVKDNLDWQDVSRIEVNLPDLPGLSIDVGEVRYYPLGEGTAHLIGYVGAVSKSELTGDPVLSLPGLKIGKTGIEKTYDKVLRGKAGSSAVEVNVVGREVRELSRDPGTPGADVCLTIDSGLQKFVQQRLAQTRSASAVVMDAHTGAIYAMGSMPSFDPNVFSRGIPADLWESLLADPGHPLNNKAISGLYPPGSTFKMVTALAALEEKVIGPGTTVYCPGHYDLNNNRFHCWKAAGHGTVDVVEALTESCDTFFYKLAADLGIDRLAEYARKFGFGQKPGVELSEERPGLFPDSGWKKTQFNEPWQPGETVVSVIGQGYIQSTPLQLAVMTARLINGGVAVRPWVTGGVGGLPAPQESFAKLGFKKKNMDLIIRGMERVVNSAQGTAVGSRIKEEGFEMGGKTGTAQVKRITKEERMAGIKNEDLPWHFRHHALFVGYAPLASPRYVCSVVVEHGGGGGAAAAPVAKDILLETQRLNPAASDVVLGGGRGSENGSRQG